MKAETSMSRRFARYIKAPIRALCRARDMYIKSMMDCASRIDYGAAAMGCPGTIVYTLPRSYSTNSMRMSEDDEIRELIRAVTKKETAQETKKKTMKPATDAVGVKTAIGRIDEDKPCYFPDDFKLGSAKPPAYSGSKSYASRRRRNASFS